ncbi:phytanoyl-CoA dioxygenase family protein [Dyadobacter sp. LJ53]|uniref:phytanoyl-CoA dioxygenase family protein n=1 Tax=Dyadobacter chenwenxiniae TaxID=2906456 RepID=UPI001F266D3C|nr:phytanoyl-CoA dioxygenase family protein [Dyadobacter chenwenxiniae]MCF0050574.1 phytanoyl-CoA dioxygenase family protein [Dyadobacter chenwenxiniae]
MEAILDNHQIDDFIHKGFLRVDNAFPEKVAEEVCDILWADLGLDRHDPASWKKPVVRLGMYPQKPFVQSANQPVLQRAYDQLVGPGKWLPCGSMGTFPIRFPSYEDPGDAGWHVDAGFPGAEPTNFFDWRINIHSKGRGLLMLFLYSDVGVHDAPTRIRVGSHLDVARLLAPKGDEGLSFMEVAGEVDKFPVREEVLATGKAGTVYLCHPFIVHAAQAHHGLNPKFMAQPPLLLRNALHILGESPVERAIRLAIS